MTTVAAMTYWVIVAIWLSVLATLVYFYIRNDRAFGTTRLLLAVLLIDTSRSLVENVYFGLYFGSQYGLFPSTFANILGLPYLIVAPKFYNIFAGSVVLCLLLWRWLPLAVTERDRTERAREIAEQAVQLKDEFTATVSHELRTPLTAITASLALLEDTDETWAAETRELISIANNNARRLRRLVDDILDIQKLEAGKTTFHFEAIDIGILLKQEIDANRALAQSADVTLRLDAPRGCQLQTDPDRLKQVISNLLSNAIKFSPPGGEVLLSAALRGDVVCLSVRDHGAGIPQEFRPRVFEKFAQADMSDSKPRMGTGLGLNIVKQIVCRLGGKVAFEDAPGGGTVFVVDLPRERQLEAAAPAERTANATVERIASPPAPSAAQQTVGRPTGEPASHSTAEPA
jgi:signal transduction histidine kinase